MDIYVVGHGFFLGLPPNVQGYHYPNNFPFAPTTFQVPNNMTIHFYVPLGHEFDSDLEKYVRGRDVALMTEKERGLSYAHETIAQNTNTANYVLTRPGGIKPDLPPAEIKGITVALDPQQRPRICTFANDGIVVQNGTTIAVKQGQRVIGGGQDESGLPCYTYLDTVAALVRQTVPNDHIDLRWAACRSSSFIDARNDDGTFDNEVLTDTEAQARSAMTKIIRT